MVNEQETQRRTSRCPLCGGGVPVEILIRGSLRCPSCGEPLRIPEGLSLVIRLTALGVGFLVAGALGLKSVDLFLVGLMISPFLLPPIWIAALSVRPPELFPVSAALTTLGLSREAGGRGEAQSTVGDATKQKGEEPKGTA